MFEEEPFHMNFEYEEDISKEVLIFSYKIARDLIQNNFAVKDIRPNHKIKSATVIVFKNNVDIQNYLKERWDIGV